MTDIDYDKMWNEIIQQIQQNYNKFPYEKSIKEFAEESGLTIGVARNVLATLVQEGKLNVRQLQRGRTRVNLYSPVD